MIAGYRKGVTKSAPLWRRALGLAYFIANLPKRPIRRCFTEFARQKCAAKYAAKPTLPRKLASKLAKESRFVPMRCNKNAVTAGVTVNLAD